MFSERNERLAKGLAKSQISDKYSPLLYFVDTMIQRLNAFALNLTLM